MKQNILYVALDVDDTQYHGSALNKDTGEALDFKCRPTLKGLLNQLHRVAGHFPGYSIKLCYEASYVGYCLQRALLSHSVHCDVVSPSSIPSPRGKTIKTDRIDAGYLAQFYANDLLTIVQPPDEEHDTSPIAASIELRGQTQCRGIVCLTLIAGGRVVLEIPAYQLFLRQSLPSLPKKCRRMTCSGKSL